MDPHPKLGKYVVDEQRRIYIIRFRGMVGRATLRSTFEEAYRVPRDEFFQQLAEVVDSRVMHAAMARANHTVARA
jgi:hypothetical protein